MDLARSRSAALVVAAMLEPVADALENWGHSEDREEKTRLLEVWARGARSRAAEDAES
jgi:hypothetical protein